MGEVYRARDLALGRDVALKILPPSFAGDPDRLTRFRREAQILASLNNPHIAAIYGFEESAAALVLELVEGPTLAERIARAPIPLDEALEIARQICEALEAAHEQGVIHRDLKPANIKLRPDGAVKVLDFGLAKLIDAATVVDTVAAMPQAAMATVTSAGLIQGTAAYMSPEQARGRDADKRSDVWAFGCVLFEMLARRRPFQGDGIAEMLAAVIHKEPDWQALPASVPAPVRRLLRRCLQKDPRKRLRDLADARLDLDEAGDGPPLASVAAAAPPRSTNAAAWIITAAMTAAAAAAIWTAMRRTPAPVATPMRVAVTLPQGTTVSLSRGPAVALAPDGRTLVYIGIEGTHAQLYLRPLDRRDAAPIAGTDGATDPFFSPNGDWIGFFADGKLKKVSAAGGAPVVLADAPNPRGETWGPDNFIYFTPRNNTGVWKVSADGGTQQEVTTLAKGELSHRWPQVLPGGKAILFTIWNDTGFENARVAVQRFGGERQIVAQGGGLPRYVAPAPGGPGYLLYAQAAGLIAAPFDPERLVVTGPSVPVLTDVITNLSGGAHLALSGNGTMGYLPGTFAEAERNLVWVDRKGAAQPVASIRAMSQMFKLSPNGRRVAHWNSLQRDLWVEELDRGTSTRLTFGGVNAISVAWSPDGQSVLHSAAQPVREIRRQRADGSGTDELLLAWKENAFPDTITPDGKSLIFTSTNAATGEDLWIMPLDGDRTPHPLIQTPFNELNGAISPDGKWLAYQSNESGRFEVYVTPFPEGGRKWGVSTDGGFVPVWAHSGRELFFSSARATMAAAITTRPEFSVGRPQALFEGRYDQWFDVSPDDQRFLMLKGMPQETSATQINLVTNWFEDLKKLTAAK